MNEREIQKSESKKINLNILLLIVIPCLISLARFADTPFSTALSQHFSLTALPHHLHEHLEYLLFVPFGALLVTFFKFPVGLRVLGVFRPVLLAVAFKLVGIPVGLAFLAFVLAINAFLVRPSLKANDTPYFARVSILLICVVMFLVAAVFAGQWLQSETLLQLAYFPIIALGLITESFSSAIKKEGLPVAIKRVAATAFVAVVITLISEISGVLTFLLKCPELLVAQIGAILFIVEYLNFRLLENYLFPQKRRENFSAKRQSGLVKAERLIEN